MPSPVEGVAVIGTSVIRLTAPRSSHAYTTNLQVWTEYHIEALVVSRNGSLRAPRVSNHSRAAGARRSSWAVKWKARCVPAPEGKESPFSEIEHPKKRAFLCGYALTGSKTRAADAVGISRATIYIP